MNNMIHVCTYDDAAYRKISNISRTKRQNLNESRIALRLSLPKILKPGDMLRMKM